MARQVKRLNASLGDEVLKMATVYDGQLLRKLKHSLEAGESVFMMGDYRGGESEKSHNVRFLGYDVNPGRGLAWLRKRTGAPLVPVIFSYPDGRPRMEIRDELKIDNNWTVDEITQQIYRTLEQEILKQPERWVLWMDYHLMLTSKARGEKIRIPSGSYGDPAPDARKGRECDEISETYSD